MNNVLINIISDDNSIQYLLFREFCLLKEKGLRKESFIVLQTFIDEALQWKFEDQIEFISWLFGLIETSDNIHHVLVHPLEEKLLKPILNIWLDGNNDSRPFRWYGLYLNTENRFEYLKKAIEIDGPIEQLALNKLIDLKFDSLWFSFHHISENSYLGEITVDRELLQEISELLTNVQDENIKIQINNDLDYYVNLLSDWEAFSNDQHDDFTLWCKEKNRNYVWIKSFYYQ